MKTNWRNGLADLIFRTTRILGGSDVFDNRSEFNNYPYTKHWYGDLAYMLSEWLMGDGRLRWPWVDIGLFVYPNDYKPTPKFIRTPWDTPESLYFGIELEYYKEYMGAAPGELKRYVYQDPVVRGLSGSKNYYLKMEFNEDVAIEVVSHPMTINTHKLMGWDRIFSKLGDGGFHTTSECGLHVHLSKSQIGDANFHKLAALIYGNQDILERWGRRLWGYHCKGKGSDELSQRDRNEAVNFLNHNTVELRFMLSTLDSTELIRTLQGVTDIVEYVKLNGLETIIHTQLVWDGNIHFEEIR